MGPISLYLLTCSHSWLLQLGGDYLCTILVVTGESLYYNSKKRRALGHSEPPKAVTGVPLIFYHRVNTPVTNVQHDNIMWRWSKMSSCIKFLVLKTIGNDRSLKFEIHNFQGSIRGPYLEKGRRYTKIDGLIWFLVLKTIGNDTHHDMNR